MTSLPSVPSPTADTVMPLNEWQPSERMMRLFEDLGVLASDLDQREWGSVLIVQTPNRVEVSGQCPEKSRTPLLATALLANLEQAIASAARVRARLPPEWQATLTEP